MAHIKTLALVAMTASAFATSALAFGEHDPQPPAGNQAQSDGVAITGTVAANCGFSGANSVSLNLGELANTDGTLNQGAVNSPPTVSITGWCNSAGSKMAVEATKLALLNAPNTIPNGFDASIDYTASAAANGHTATDTTTSSGAGTPVTVGAFTGTNDIVISLTLAQASGLLLAGNYQGTVTVTLSPS